MGTGMQLWGIENSRDGNKAVGLWLWSFERRGRDRNKAVAMVLQGQ
jgi:hypothetical protein